MQVILSWNINRLISTPKLIVSNEFDWSEETGRKISLVLTADQFLVLTLFANALFQIYAR